MPRLHHYKPWIIPGQTPAFAEDFYGMPWREVDAFVEEMKTRIPERIVALERYVRSTRGFAAWRANRSRASLRPIGPWLMKVLTTRRLTRSEKVPRLLRPLPAPLTMADIPLSCAPDEVISEEWQGVLVDVGLYFGECLRKANPKWYWRRSTIPRSYADFNQPTLIFGQDTTGGFPPFTSPSIVAEQMWDHEAPRSRFYDMFAEYRKTFE